MKRLVYLVILLSTVIFTGCGEQINIEDMKIDFEKQLQKATNGLPEDEVLSKYLLNINIEESTYENYYDVAGKLDGSFDNLSRKEQFEFLKHAIDLINEIEVDNGGELKRDEFDIYRVDFSTDSERYWMIYDPDVVDAAKGYYELQVGDYSYDSYDSNGNLIEEEDLAQDEDPIQLDLATGNGDNWIQMTYSEKSESISMVISALEARGYNILKDPDQRSWCLSLPDLCRTNVLD
ncbi:hypothetical protein [Bacillus benzoevorans]|uniref:Lipoprotein n=1 Tax=Bacillus benzoevorans TaxID=1456 RepID=A0A7X0HXU9_9BACI|nr:hypothetical protein [Bacillus benzoevorans]MBB6447992.1 hypothetical protein [Bacillus benzoevorans]